MTNLGKGGFDKLANLRKGASNEQVRAFVERKKTGLPKCALEQVIITFLLFLRFGLIILQTC